jgi:hypothetical protein
MEGQILPPLTATFCLTGPVFDAAMRYFNDQLSVMEPEIRATFPGRRAGLRRGLPTGAPHTLRQPGTQTPSCTW